MICPLLSACRQKVTMEHYSSVCANVTRDAYKECAEFKRLSSEQRTPVEWARLTAPAAA